MDALLQLIGEGSDQQIATEAQRRSGAVKLTPSKPQLRCRSIGQAGDFGFDLAQARLSCAGRSGCRLDRQRATARQSAGEPTHCGWGLHALAGSAMR
jgi:hypothetical protein